jgi:hypothetical protein
VAEVYEALAAKEKMRQMFNSEDAASSSGEALNIWGRTEQKKSNSGGKGKGNQKGRSKSKDHPMSCFADTARGKTIILRTVENCRTRRRGMTHQSIRVKLMVVPVIIVLIMMMFLSLLLDASNDSVWILDSTCSYHVHINKASFSTYEPV